MISLTPALCIDPLEPNDNDPLTDWLEEGGRGVMIPDTDALARGQSINRKCYVFPVSVDTRSVKTDQRMVLNYLHVHSQASEVVTSNTSV